MPLRSAMLRRSIGFLLLGVLAGGAGCIRAVDTTPERKFLLGDDRGAIEGFAERLVEPSKREALDANLLGTAAWVGGDWATARRAFIDAGMIMGSFPSEQTGAIIGAEGSKIYLGDPYEGAMNSLYTALALLATGDEENARAALKNGILIDSDVKEEKYRSDIAALFLLEAWLSLRIGKDDLAEKDLEVVRRILPDCPLADPELLRGANTIVAIDVGDGPQKIRTGKHGELASFATPKPVERALSLTIGEQITPLVEGVDVSFQATTRGGRSFDGILRGKAVFKEVAEVAGVLVIDDALSGRKKSNGKSRSSKEIGAQLAVGGGLLILSALTRAEADIRHWHLLPAATYLWIGRVDPGLHTVDLRVRGASGPELATYRQTWHHIPFSEDRMNVLYLRTGPHRGFGNTDSVAPGNRGRPERGSP